MNLEDYEALPDGMAQIEVALLLRTFLQGQDSDTRRARFLKLQVTAEKQWHTYELPGSQVRAMLMDWIEKNWVNENDFRELVLGLAYAFGLPRALFERALNSYVGAQAREYSEMLSHANSDSMDPYWSLPTKKQLRDLK